MKIEISSRHDVPAVVSILKEADEWLSGNNQSLWTANEIGFERITQDVDAGKYYAAYKNMQIAGVMRLEKEDTYFWPEISPGTSIYVHKLAVRRVWAGKGVSEALLNYAKIFARELMCDYVRLDCFANRERLRLFYEKNGFSLRDVNRKGSIDYARYEAFLY
ncbi:GNAT family N-acetyltransferase [Methylobacterium sp. NPDC080182]|uniref:GNAT family N-acetyltransferase n=1 Tax=Methylobacterium sp. NPDC080182 TaxID=3390590 RepID=UPI003D064020